MTKKIGIRELARNIKILDEYDLIEIEDKKSKKSKGIFVSNKYAEEIKKLIEEKEKKEKEAKLDRILQFAGILEGEIPDVSHQELKAMKREKYEE